MLPMAVLVAMEAEYHLETFFMAAQGQGYLVLAHPGTVHIQGSLDQGAG
jgi:hypothetical protein